MSRYEDRRIMCDGETGKAKEWCVLGSKSLQRATQLSGGNEAVKVVTSKRMKYSFGGRPFEAPYASRRDPIVQASRIRLFVLIDGPERGI